MGRLRVPSLSRSKRPSHLPCWAATWAVGGRPLRAQSPSANTLPSASPFTRRLLSTAKPLLGMFCPASGPRLVARSHTKGRVAMPAAHTSAPKSMASSFTVPPPPPLLFAVDFTVALWGPSTAVTPVQQRTHTPCDSRCAVAWFASASWKGPKIRGAASRSVMRTLGAIPGKRRETSERTKSLSSAASSTPVGPPPTTTKCSSFSTASALAAPPMV
mmetsp:Transcript_35717/g.72791  ORF Transcript_35717/g.72791 Transcript_35717/m.72791 type:complete len:216 (+) Transcript_35717:530-1177(+)